MEPKIIERDAFWVMGIIGHFPNAQVDFNPLWKQYSQIHTHIKHRGSGEGNIGVYLDSNHSKPIDYLAGIIIEEIDNPPENVRIRKVPAAKYVVFSSDFEKLKDTYDFIFNEWLADSKYKQDKSKLGFDLYPEENLDEEVTIQIWMPITE